jgi:hypothetical protein
MIKPRMLAGALLLFFAGLPAFGQDLPLQATITPASTEVKVNQTFAVSVVVRNTSSEEQALEFSTCGEGIVWQVDSPLVRPHGEGYCKKSGHLRVALKPGETFESTLHAHIEVADGERLPESVTFRLEISYDDRETPPKGVCVWSNAATVGVTR